MLSLPKCCISLKMLLPCVSRLNMQFAPIEQLFLFLRELRGGILKIMFISILESRLSVLGAVIIFTSFGHFFYVKCAFLKNKISFGLGGMPFLGCMSWLSNTCWKSWPVLISPRKCRSYSSRTFLKLFRWFVF